MLPSLQVVKVINQKRLEDFWLEVSESNMQIIPDLWTYEWDSYNKEFLVKKISSAL